MNKIISREKRTVYEYWNTYPCGAGLTKAPRYTKRYFDEIEERRYAAEPHLWSFAQFSRYSGKKVLEIGVGIGIDFLQWVRSGCVATGCDLTPAAIEHTRKLLEIYNLKATVKEEDCEALSFPDESFDLVYCMGVIHHTPDAERAVSEIYRVLKKGGIAKVMLYHRYSWPVLNLWIRYGLKKGRPFRSIDDIVYHCHEESPGTKVYSIRQAEKLFQKFSKKDMYIQLTVYDFCCAPKIISRKFTNLTARALGSRVGWNLMITAVK